jgi:hypothetical protein
MITYFRLVLVALFFGFAFASAQKPPASDRDFYNESEANLVKTLRLRQPDLSSPTEREIHEEAKSLDVLTKFSTPLWVGSGCGTSSHPTLGIIVDLDQLDTIRRQAQGHEFSYILRWLLAHEKTHQMQFRSYSTSILNQDLPERQMYEAQADLLAAKYLMETMTGSASDEQTDAIIEALRVSYDLGVEQYALADHPSRESRLSAVRLGMAAGMITKLQRLGGDPALQSASVLVNKLDIRLGEDTLAWSLRTSKRIVNYRLPAIVDLVLAEEQVTWSKDPAHPVVSYWMTYENRGARSITVNLEVQSVAAPRADPDDIFRWQKISVMNHDFDLNPGGQKVVTGSLRWEADANLMPVLIAPPKPTALVLVQYTGGNGTVSANDLRNRLDAIASAGTRQTFSSVLDRILQGSIDQFSSLRAGPGRKVDDVVAYASEVNFPAALRTDVWLPERGSDASPYVRSALVDSPDVNASSLVFDQALERLKTALSALGRWSENSSPRGERRIIASHTFSRGNLAIELINRSRGNPARYEVALTVRLSKE